MKPECIEPHETPPIGAAMWLLRGRGGVIERIEWLRRNGFQGLSFLHDCIGCRDAKEREDAAALIAEAGMHVTFHGNVNRAVEQGLDADYIQRIIDEVSWWQAHTGGRVFSCCLDPYHVQGKQGAWAFHYARNRRYMTLLADKLSPLGIRVGIENAFGQPYALSSLASLARFKAVCAPQIVLLLDVGHANVHVRSDGVGGESEIGDYVSRLPMEIAEIHFSDNFGREDEHRYLGYGNLDLRSLFRALQKINFQGKFTIEVAIDISPAPYHADFTDPAKTDPILKSRDLIGKLWQETAREQKESV